MAILANHDSIKEAIRQSDIPVSSLSEDAEMILNEAYFGRKPNIQRMIEDIRQIRNDIGKTGGSTYKGSVLHTHPAYEDFKQAIKDEFGFLSVGIVIDSGMKVAPMLSLKYQMANLNGNGLVANTNRALHVKVSKSGITYTKAAAATITLIMSARYWDANCDISPEETVAVILHEIGHSFSGTMTVAGYGVLSIRTILSSYAQLFEWGKWGGHSWSQFYDDVATLIKTTELAGTVTSVGMELVDKIDYTISKAPGIGPIYNKVKDIGNNLESIFQRVYLIFVKLERQLNAPEQLANLNKRIQWMVNMITHNVDCCRDFFYKLGLSTLGYFDEKVADEFPVMYGLGPEFVTGMDKISRMPTEEVSIPVLGPLADLYLLIPTVVASAAFDPHPNINARYRNVHNQLARELKNPNLDDESRSMLKQQLKEADEAIDSYYNSVHSFKEAIGDERVFTKIYGKMVYKMMGGDLKHHVIGRGNQKRLDKRIARAERREQHKNKR